MNKELKIRSVKYNLMMNIILKLSGVIFPFITFPYISRVLGATNNGKIAFAASVIQYLTFLASLGIPTYGVKACAQYRDDKQKLSKIVKELLLISSITTILSYIIFVILLFFVPKFYEEKTLMIIHSMGIILSVYGFEWFYQAIEQYDYITYRNIAFKIISIILMFLFVHKTEDYLIYATISVICGGGSSILNLIRLKKYVDFKTKTEVDLKIHFKPILTLFMLSAASMIYTSLDSVMLGFISTDVQVGYYNAAVKVKNILVSVVTALGVVLLPRLSNTLANGREDEFNGFIKKSFNFSFLSSLPFALFCIFEATRCILFLAGEGYIEAILPMQLISPSIIFIALSNIIGIQILIPTGKELYTLISTVAGAIVNLILNAYLIYYFQSSGAAMATTIAEAVVLAVQVYYVKSNLKNYVDYTNISKILFASIISSIVLLSFNNFILIESVLLGILLSGALFFVTYGFSLLILKEKVMLEVYKSLLNRINTLLKL